ncbi:MAG TPA: exodeoxyribonuclease VII large subunit [Defluviitaleaceae bacterium]|nr:exodeoxyribonuclease VII large subunit [Defluviitaleaceae bacterium]
MMNKKVLTVSDVNHYIKALIDSDYVLSNIWVEGEISNFKRHSSGHIYFTLKDKDGAISCIMFRSSAAFLRFDPQNGMNVIVKGSVSVYEKTGQYQIYVSQMEQKGIGALYEAYERLKEKLEKEGLFLQAHKKAIPAFPEVVGIITSPTGAAIRDIIQISKRRNPNIKLVVYPVLVQGEQAPGEIAHAIYEMNQWGQADVLIVGRGGGSLEDLWAFNEEIVARAIFESKIPVISAVGHETDYTIADFVADLRAPTPSAAAELAVPLLKDLRLRVHIAYKTLNHLMEDKIYSELEKLKKINQSVPFRKPLDRIYKKQQDLDSLEKILNNSMKHILEKKRSQFGKEIKALEALSPLNTLLRGYSITLSKEGRNISSIGDVKVEDAIYIKLKDGIIDAVVKGIQEDEEGFDG